MQPDFFLETSALIDWVFRRPQIRDHMLQEMGQNATHHTSRYVIFELSRGYLKHLLVLHNKATDLEAFSALIEYVRRRNIGPQYAGQTMLGAYTDFITELEQNGKRLDEAQRLRHFRAWLALLIRRGWKTVNGTAFSISNPIGCKDQLPAPAFLPVRSEGRPKEHASQDLPSSQCGQANNCSLIRSLQTSRSGFESLVVELGQLEKTDTETQRRIEALGRLLVQPDGEPFKGKDCYSAGDAIIAHECDTVHTIVSKNERHFGPICASMGKTLLSYKEPTV